MKIINLLPRHKQEELRYEQLFHSVSMAAGAAAAIMIAVLVCQIGVRLYLNYSARTLEAKTEAIRTSTDKTENNQLKEQIKLSNAQMNDYRTLAESIPNWSKVIMAFAATIPDGVSITSFTASLDTKKILINGQSPTREAVIQLYNNILADTKNFKDIDYPLENVAKPADVTFFYNFSVNEEALK